MDKQVAHAEHISLQKINISMQGAEEECGRSEGGGGAK